MEIKSTSTTKTLFVFFMCFLVSCGGGGEESNESEASNPYLPLTNSYQKNTYPKLVNYFHNMWQEKYQDRIDVAKYLAKWDVVILNPDEVEQFNVDLSEIKKLNPKIKILAWIPYGQEPLNSIKSTLTSDELDALKLRNTSGEIISTYWGGYMMNPFTNNYEWPNFLADWVAENITIQKGYDGVMFDWFVNFTPYSGDLNNDGLNDGTDNSLYESATNLLAQQLRDKQPGIIITGNAGFPIKFSAPCEIGDGNMHEAFFSAHLEQTEHPKISKTLILNNLLANHCEDPYSGADTRYHFMIGNVNISKYSPSKNLTCDDMRTFRLGYVTSLLNDGFFGFDKGDGKHGQLWWFDEYNINIGSPTSDYNGTNISFRESIYFEDSISREFSNGTALINASAHNQQINFAENRTQMSTGITSSEFMISPYDADIFINTTK